MVRQGSRKVPHAGSIPVRLSIKAGAFWHPLFSF